MINFNKLFKIFVAVIFIVLLFTYTSGETTKIYDNNHHYIGKVHNNKVYDKKGHLLYKIKEGTTYYKIYDKKGRYVGKIKKEK